MMKQIKTPRQKISITGNNRSVQHLTLLQPLISDLDSEKSFKNRRWGVCAEAMIAAAKIGGAVVFCLAIFEREAHAYTDPGSGALLWQALMAGAIGLSYYGHKFWKLVRKRCGGEEDKTGKSDVQQREGE